MSNGGYAPAGYDEIGSISNGQNIFVPAGYEGAAPASPPELYQPGYPAGAEVPGTMNPWPNVSPYEANFNQTRQDQGLWFNEQNNLPRRWYGGFDGLWLEMRRPGNKVIGHEVVLRGNRLVQINGVVTLIPSNINAVRELNREFVDDFGTGGVMPFIGFTNPDDSGAEFNGYFLGKTSDSTKFPLGIFPAEVNQVFLAAPDNPIQPQLRFDSRFEAKYQEESWGAEAMVYTTPILGGGMNKLRGIYGLRYIGLNEKLNVAAIDSIRGLTTIETSVSSQLVGPELGLRWDLGGDKLKVFSYGKVGALGNFDRRRIETMNYGGTNTILREKHSHVSPMLEFGVFAEAPLFGYLPLIKKIPFVQDGIFRFGWTFTEVFLMARPADIITYGNPVPVIDYDPQDWWMHGTHYSIYWKF